MSCQYAVHRSYWQALLIFSLLSSPAVSDSTGGMFLSGPAPQPRQPIKLFGILKRYAAGLFDCEGGHYPQAEELLS